MMKRVDMGPAPKKHAPPKVWRCPGCDGPATEVRSKTTRIALVNDEKIQVSDKRWTHRGVICHGTCGVFLSEKDRQAEFDFDND